MSTEDLRGYEDGQRRRLITYDDESAHTTPDYGRDEDMDGIEDEEEDQRSVDASSEGGERDGYQAAEASTSGSRTNSTSSIPNDSLGGPPVVQKTQAAFVHKLWSMLHTPALSRLIAWTDDGKAFTVFYPTEFARTVLPQFFKHSNFASFIRQLNMYSFAKVNDALGAPTSHTNPDGSQVQAWEFQNAAFQRDRPDLLAKIRRKSAKASAVVPPSSSRRRSSIVRSNSSKQDMRKGTLSDGTGDEDEPAPRVNILAAAAAVASNPTTPSVLFGDGRTISPRPSKVIAGVTDFAPQNGAYDSRQRPRPKEDHPTDVSSNRSPAAAQSRHQNPYPPPYHHSNSYHSPPTSRSQLYPASQAALYSANRPPYPEDHSNRQIAALESQVRSLGEALFHTQQDYMATRAASYSVLGMLLGIVADLDVSDKRKEEVESCSIALSKLHPDASNGANTYPLPLPSQQAYPPLQASPYSSSQYPTNGQGSPRGTASTSTYHQQYNRIPTTESYARSSRPDSRSQEQHPSSSSSLLSAAFRPSPIPQSSVRPVSPAPPSTAGSNNGQATSSGLAAAYPQQAYPSPRANWPGAASSSIRTTSLPSLSSLLEGVPANGERRANEIQGGELDPADERARKKMRQ